jgi:hypothetical protein
MDAGNKPRLLGPDNEFDFTEIARGVDPREPLAGLGRERCKRCADGLELRRVEPRRPAVRVELQVVQVVQRAALGGRQIPGRGRRGGPGGAGGDRYARRPASLALVATHFARPNFVFFFF